MIRTSDTADAARERLMSVFDLSQPQAEYILELRLRRLTRFSTLELEREAGELREEIADLEGILADDARLRTVVSDEMAEVVQVFGTPRRTILLEHAGGNGLTGVAAAPRSSAGAASLEIADTPCVALLSGTGLVARTADDAAPVRGGRRSAHDVVVATAATTTRSEIGVVTSRGRVLRLSVVDLPALPPTDGPPSLSGGAPVAELVALERGERVVGLTGLGADAPTLALGTAVGIVKRVAQDAAPSRDAWEVIALKDDDEVVGAVPVTDSDELVLITSDAQLLHFPASAVRPQGRAAGGMAGIKLAAGSRVVFAGAVVDPDDAVVVTVAGAADALPGTQAGSAKVSPFAAFPGKGRATGGVRAQRFLRGEDGLILAWAGPAPARASGAAGQPIELPEIDQRRDGSGVALAAPVHTIG